MNRAHLWLSATLLLTAVVTISCGGGTAPNRMIESISISPAVTTAQNGQAQFVATGTFSAPPVTVTPLLVSWSAPGALAGPTVACSTNGCGGISAQGLAVCGQDASGTFPITASAPSDPNAPLGTPTVPVVSGTATLTCP